MSAGNIRIALSLSRPQLVQYLSAWPADLRMRLREKELVTATEAARLADTQDAHGAVGQAEALVDILEKRTEEEIRGFMTGMEEYDERIPQLIEENINGGRAVLEKLRDHLKTVYSTSNYHVIQSLPGERFQLDVKKGDYVMPLAFSVERLQQEEQQRGLLPSEEMDSRYERAYFREVEEVLKALAESEDSRLAICTANAGTGKTVLIHRLVTQWMGDQDHMSNYVVVFSLHVRDININNSIIDILKDGNNQSGFVPQEFLSLLPNLLSSQDTASKILILVDGVDEKDIPKDSEISKLLRGDMYKFVTVLFTSRPEGTVFATLKNLKPMFKIKISGTTREGVHDFLKKMIRKSSHNTSPSTEEVERLIKECEENMVEFEILQIPLYLTLIGFVLNEYWAKQLSFKGFVVPRTVTQLFSAFMQVLLRVWLERIGRSGEAKVLMFNRSPIEKDSGVPIDIQGKLVAFGKMCYYNLLVKNYTFTKTDLDNYFILEKDIKDCGLFCVSEDQELFEFFLKHKQIQEYLAGVYLCSAQFNDSSFRDLVQSAEKNHSTLCLNDIFKDIEWTLLFLFGLDTKFGLDILKQLKTHVCVIKSDDAVELGYEARLVTEANDRTVCEVMREVLTSAQVVEREEYSFRAPVSSMYELCQGLTTQQRCTLLTQWYRLEVTEVTHPHTSHHTEVTHTHTSHYTEVTHPHTSHHTGTESKQTETYWVIKNIEIKSAKSPKIQKSKIDIKSAKSHKIQKSKLEIKSAKSHKIQKLKITKFFLRCIRPENATDDSSDDSSIELDEVETSLKLRVLDIINYLLLCEFTFPTVQSLHIKESRIYDVGLIQRVFPALHTLCIDDGYPDLDAALDTVMCSAQAEPPTTLTHVTLKALGGTLPPCSVRSLLRLHHLHTLRLLGDMLTDLSRDMCDTSWPRLHTLEMCLVGIDDDRAVSVWEKLCLLLTRTPALTQLTFGCYLNDNRLSPQTTAALQSLLQHLTHHSPHLHTLRLHEVLHPCDLEAVCAGLAELTQVTTLGLGWKDVRGDLDLESFSADCDESVLRMISRGVRSAPHVTHIQVLYGGWGEESAAPVAEQLRAHCPHVHIHTQQWDLAHV